MTPQQFFDKYGFAFIVATEGTGLFPSVKAAQAALETGYGRTINIAGNNRVGIKADPTLTGRVISNSTSEVIGGVRKSFTGTGKTYINRTAAIADGANSQTLFRAYMSITESIVDHTKFLRKNARYRNVLSAQTPEAQSTALQTAGYATANNYSATLISIINTYALKKLDEKKK